MREGFIAITITNPVVQLLTVKQLAKHLMPDFLEEAKRKGGKIRRDSFHEAELWEYERFQLDKPDNGVTFICYMESADVA